MQDILARILLSAVSIATIFFTAAGVIGQDLDDVAIGGRVVDTHGRPIAGARITATLMQTGAERKVLTDRSGRYRLIELQPATYRVRAEADGFGAVVRNGLRTISGTDLRLDFRLDPAPLVVEPVEVASDGASAAADAAALAGGTVTSREIEDFPNSSANVLDLVFTLGGAAEEPFSIRNLAEDRIGGGSEADQPAAVTGAGSYSLSGGAAYSTNITIDGLDNNDDRLAAERFQPPPAAVAEVQVIANQFSAEYGRASGGRINIRTRAGAKRLRARLFLFFEDDGLNANSFNNNRRGLARLPFTEWHPGGTLSGPVPVFGRRTFFFASYAYENRSAATRILTALPVDRNRRYPLPAPTDPADRRIDLQPGPDDMFPAVEIAGYRIRAGTPARRHRLTQRIDHSFSDRHNLTFGYRAGRSKNFRQYRETTRFLKETLQGRIRRTDSFYVTDNYVLSGSTVNQLRFQFSTYRPGFAAVAGADRPVVIVFISDESRAGSPDQVRGPLVVGNSTANFASLRSETRLQLQETLTAVRGGRSLKAGFDIQTITSKNLELRDATGTYNFARVADFLANRVSRFRRNFGSQAVQKNTYYGLFLQTGWDLPAAGLTLSAGVRYERETLVADKNNFGPRLGLVYTPDRRSAIRLGGGIFYNRVLLRTLDDYSLGRSILRFDSDTLVGPDESADCLTDATSDKCLFLDAVSRLFPQPPDLPALRSLLNTLKITTGGFSSQTNFTRLIEPGIRIPESYQLNAAYERNLGRGFILRAAYTYNHTVRLWRETNINAYRPPPGFATLTEYLLSLGAIDLGGTVTTFVLGDPSDPVGTFDPDRTGSRTNCTAGSESCIVNLRTLNNSAARTSPIGRARAALRATLKRPYDDDLDQVERVGSVGRSRYSGLQLELRRRFRDLGSGFRGSLRLVYLWSQTLDDGFVDTSSAQTPGDFQGEFGPSGTDRRHRLRFSGVLILPGWAGGLRLAPLLRLESGRPFNISIGGRDRNLDDVGNDRPDYAGDLNRIVSRRAEDPFPRALAASFSLAPIGSSGNLPRNAGRGPKLFIFDLSIGREFVFGRQRLRPQITFDNVLNTTTYSFGSDFIDLRAAGTPEFARGFLVPARTLRPRRVRIGIRIDF